MKLIGLQVALGIICGVLLMRFLPYLARSVRFVSSMETSLSLGKYTVSYVTVPNKDTAEKLAHGLVEKKLAACVNIVPGITSVYQWKGKIEKDSELLMIIKSMSRKSEELTKFVRENHPYEVCEVVTTPIQHGNPPYLDWINNSLSCEKTE